MPWFVNWDDYKTNFEQEAAKILGHPVQVLGSANASILPSPSLTFTDVRVGGDDGAPMMTVDRFEVTIELTPLLQGEIRVVSMRLERPVLRIAVDASGANEWFQRAASADTLDPDRVALADVAITDGSVSYSDARTGVALAFSGITAAVEARSLAGPWRIDGSYIDDGVAVPFSFGTGRQLEDGTIRLTAAVSPRQLPIDVTADGVVANDAATGLSYTGTYTVEELVENVTGEVAEIAMDAGPAGWRSEGAFALTGDRLVIDKAVLSNGPPDRPSSLAGALTLTFGASPSFDVTAEARQLDLDRTLGGGPNEPVDVAAAGDRLVAWLAGLQRPAIPGRIAFNVPAIVVGGSVIQDVGFTASPTDEGWRVEGLRARLPGQADVTADGIVATDGEVGFVGTARLAVAQPATFASWWRGRSNAGAGRQLAAFDIAGSADISRGRVALDDIDARIGGAGITGSFSWVEANDGTRRLGADLEAGRIDFDQVQALGELIAGRDLAASALADSYSLRLAADEFRYDDILMRGIAVDAGYADDVLNVVQLSVADLGGSSFRVTSGRIDDLSTQNPRGHLSARLEVASVDGLAAIVGRFLPESSLVEWLGRTADVTTPAQINARVSAPAAGGTGGIGITIDGVAGATVFSGDLVSASARSGEWLTEAAEISLTLDSPDSAALARQLGLTASAIANDPGAHIEIDGSGVPRDGLDVTVTSEFAGLRTHAAGQLVLAADAAPSFDGSFGIATDDLSPLMAFAGLSVPGTAASSVAMEGSLAIAGASADLVWQNATIGDRVVGGTVTIARTVDRGWRLDGDLAADAVDLDWLMSLGLGIPPLPTGSEAEPWSKEPFASPGYGALSGKLAIAAERLAVGGPLDIANARLAVSLQPQRIDVDLAEGDVAGGKATGGFSIHNVEGNANVSGQFSLAGAALESFVWRPDERAVATGLFDLSASFEGTGRSPAGLIASMTGGGVVGVSDAEARYVDLAPAVQQIIRASDLGQEFTEDALSITLAEQIGANTLAVGETGGAFTVAAGALRLRGVALRGEGIEGEGNVVLDLNSMSVDSDWTFAFDPGDDKVEGADPRVGVVFRGPLSSPTRTIDALPLGSYLNTRREARILEVIALEEASRAEKERLDRLVLKLQQDADRSARLAAEAAERERLRREMAVATAAAVFGLHTEREILVDQRAAEALQRASDRATEASEAAAAAATALAASADAERARATELAAALPQLVAADEAAAASAAASTAEYDAARQRAEAGAALAASALAYAEEAEAAALAAMGAETAASAASLEANAERANAEQALATADAALAAATSTADAARTEMQAAQAALDAAGRAVSEALLAHDNAIAAVAAAEAELAEGQSAATSTGTARAEAAQRALRTSAERERLQAAIDAAAERAATASAARDAAAARVAETDAAFGDAEKALAGAATVVESATAVAEALAADTGSDAQTVTGARGIVTAAKLRQAARKADVDRILQERDAANAALRAAEAAVAETAAAATAAQTGIADSDAAARSAETLAKAAVAANAAALNALADATAARDAAIAEAEMRATAAQEAGAAFDAAQVRAAAAADAVTSMEAAANSAGVARTEAAAVAADKIDAAEAAASAAASALAARETAVAAALAARQASDAAAAEAQTAAATYAAMQGAHEAALAAAEAARTARAEGEAAAAAADVSAAAAEVAAADAADEAAARAAEAEAAAARLLPPADDEEATIRAAPANAVIRQPLSLDALAGDQPLILTPTP